MPIAILEIVRSPGAARDPSESVEELTEGNLRARPEMKPTSQKKAVLGLPWEEWALHEVPLGMEFKALEYELHRERLRVSSADTIQLFLSKCFWPFSPKPWLSVPPTQMKAWLEKSSEDDAERRGPLIRDAKSIVDLKGQVLRLTDSFQLAEERGVPLSASGPLFEGGRIGIHAIEIEWGATDSELVLAFRQWLKGHRRPQRRRAAKMKAPKARNLLGYLAAFRLARAAAGAESAMLEFKFDAMAFAKVDLQTAKPLGEFAGEKAWYRAIGAARGLIRDRTL